MGPQGRQLSPDAYRAQREIPALMTEDGKQCGWSRGTQGGGWVLVERGWPESGIQGKRGVEGHMVDGTGGREGTGWLGHGGLGTVRVYQGARWLREVTERSHKFLLCSSAQPGLELWPGRRTSAPCEEAGTRFYPRFATWTPGAHPTPSIGILPGSVPS